MISDNYIPEKINEYNVYLDGVKMIGVASSHTLPEVNMQTSTVSGMGVNGEVYDKSTGGGYAFKSLRIVEMGRVKKFKPGKIEKAESMEATITLELTYLLVEVDGVVVMEIDKLNQVYNVNGVDMLADVRNMT